MKGRKPTLLAKLLLATLVVFLVEGQGVILAQAEQQVQPKHYKQLTYPPLRDFKIPQPTRFELANGMVVFLLEDHELPTISASAMIRVGSRWEPPDKVGLAEITGTVMRTGGTLSRSGDELDEQLERLAASVETFIGRDSGGAWVSVLKEDIDTGLAILGDVLRHPAFPEDKLELAKIQHRDRIARRNDNPMSIAFREFNRLLYGADSPYGRITEYATIEAITRDDLVAFHRRFYYPNRVILGVVGDFDPAPMKAKIEKVFGDWKPTSDKVPAPPPVRYDFAQRQGVYFIQKDDVNQSSVLMGHLGGLRKDPDYYALAVMNQILGGGFSSRLFQRVRSQQGLAYAVFSTWNAGYDHTGSFYLYGGTKSETTHQIIGSLKKEIVALTQGDVTGEELRIAKEGILNSFVFEFDSRRQILNRILTYEYYAYPHDFLQRFKRGIEKVSRPDIQRVAKTYLRPDQMIVLVLGNEAHFEKPLSILGRVTPVDITIPSVSQK